MFRIYKAYHYNVMLESSRDVYIDSLSIRMGVLKIERQADTSIRMHNIASGQGSSCRVGRGRSCMNNILVRSPALRRPETIDHAIPTDTTRYRFLGPCY